MFTILQRFQLCSTLVHYVNINTLFAKFNFFARQYFRLQCYMIYLQHLCVYVMYALVCVLCINAPVKKYTKTSFCSPLVATSIINMYLGSFYSSILYGLQKRHFPCSECLNKPIALTLISSI